MRHVHDAVAHRDDETAHPGPDGRPETRPGVDARRPAHQRPAARLNERPQPPAKRSALNASLYATGGDRDRHDGIIQSIRAVRVHPVHRVIGGVAVEVDAAAVADGVPGEEPALLRVVVAVGTQDQTRLGVRIVARLAPEAEHVRPARAGDVAEGVVQVRGHHAPAAARALGDVAALVEGVPERAAGGAARDQAPRPEHGLGGDAAAGVEFADGHAAVVEVIGARSGVVLLPAPQAVAAIVSR